MRGLAARRTYVRGIDRRENEHVRLACIAQDGDSRVAVVGEDVIRVLAPETTMMSMLTASQADRARAVDRSTAELAPDEVELRPPLYPASLRDFSVFEAHIEGAVKTGGDAEAQVPELWYETPFCYFSNPHAITGPGDAIRPPAGTRALDLELEVAVVIGARGRDLTPSQASSVIVGYTIWNDWSARDIGGREIRMPFGQCKSKDFANTLGPWIVTPDELETYRADERLALDMHATINGVSLGEDTLANMAWSFEELVSFASRGAWIAPGDVIGSGTCGSGCLMEFWGRRGRQDPPPLATGDVVSLHVDGIGTLTNTVAEPLPELAPLPRARPRRGMRIAS
jgi:2-keto-4-pentenoate hydratase/2-oxohepta-3-ene-1,7-dioic acid hydratase in catechol pathway